MKNGTYYAVLNFVDERGRRKSKWVSLGLSEKGNKRKAEEKLMELRKEFVPPVQRSDMCADMPFHEYLSQWLEIARSRIEVVTYASYKNMIETNIAPYFDKRNISLRELEPRHIQAFYSERLRVVKPNTVIHYHALIHSALQYAYKTDLVPQNVASKVDRPKKNDFQPVFLSAEEMQKMFEALKGSKMELPVLIAAFYGLRRGEIMGLKWDAIDFVHNTISIKRTVTTALLDGKRIEIEKESGKTKSSMRTLPLVGQFR